LRSRNLEADTLLTKVRVKYMSPGSGKCDASRVTWLEPVAAFYWFTAGLKMWTLCKTRINF